MLWNQRQMRFWHLAGAISESRPVCSRESEFPPTFEVVRYRKNCGIQTKRDEHVKYKHTKS